MKRRNIDPGAIAVAGITVFILTGAATYLPVLLDLAEWMK